MLGIGLQTELYIGGIGQLGIYTGEEVEVCPLAVATIAQTQSTEEPPGEVVVRIVS